MKLLTFVEIDLDHCTNTYGVLPCTAHLDGDDATGTAEVKELAERLLQISASPTNVGNA